MFSATQAMKPSATVLLRSGRKAHSGVRELVPRSALREVPTLAADGAAPRPLSGEGMEDM
jgi:hypothetical protein